MAKTNKGPEILLRVPIRLSSMGVCSVCVLGWKKCQDQHIVLRKKKIEVRWVQKEAECVFDRNYKLSVDYVGGMVNEQRIRCGQNVKK